jgi:hypothetical protein
VHAGHDPVVVADDGLAAALNRSAAEGAQLADGVVVADDELGVLAGVFLVLRFLADRRELKMRTLRPMVVRPVSTT